MAKPVENMRIWDALGKTDPSHTKQFTRAGGFKGTAVKPMWANKQMTEFFGPCGIGWGQEQPSFQTMPTGDEILVYCTVGLWYMDGGARKGPVYGVGGDKVLTQIFAKDGQGNKIRGEDGKFKTYPQTDDEAFKKAYTDALSNAMKFVGVAADIHMGMFDDNKYVQSVREEFKAEEEDQRREVFAEVERQKAAAPPVATLAEVRAITAPPSELDWMYNKGSGILICRIVDAKKKQKKDGKGEYVELTLNRELEGKKLVYYWHSTHRDLLLGAKGHIVKLEVVGKEKGFTVENVLEVAGNRIAREPESEGDTSTTKIQGKQYSENVGRQAEIDARLLASTLDFSEEDLRELYSRFCNASWPLTLAKLRERKAELDAKGEEIPF